MSINPAEDFYFDKPKLIDRIKSTLIDGVVIMVLMILVANILNVLGIESGLIRGLSLLLTALYEPIMTSFGRTLGQYIIGLKVSRYQAFLRDQSQLAIFLPQAIFRFLIKILLGWVSLLSIHADPYGRAIHDKVAQSIMTKV